MSMLRQYKLLLIACNIILSPDGKGLCQQKLLTYVITGPFKSLHMTMIKIVITTTTAEDPERKTFQAY